MMAVSPRMHGAVGRTRTCIAPIKSRALWHVELRRLAHYFAIRKLRMRLRFCSAVAIVINPPFNLGLALGIEPRISALRLRRVAPLS